MAVFNDHLFLPLHSLIETIRTWGGRWKNQATLGFHCFDVNRLFLARRVGLTRQEKVHEEIVVHLVKFLIIVVAIQYIFGNRASPFPRQAIKERSKTSCKFLVQCSSWGILADSALRHADSRTATR